MPEPEIRPFRPEDADASAPLFRRLIRGQIHTGPAIRHWVESQPARARMQAWTIVDSGGIIGWGNAHLRWAIQADDVAGGWVGVLPEHRNRGLGSKLYRLAEAHASSLGAKRFTSFVDEDRDEGRAFARHRGFREGRRDQNWELEVAAVALSGRQVAAGTEVMRLREVVARQRDLFELFDAAHSDMPGDDPYTLEFDEWLREALGDPTLDHDVSSVVLVEGRPASFAWINTDREGGYGQNEMTGTHPDFRRRGLARLAKEASTRWAAEAGIRTLFTSNDTTNADMLALNDHLGYRPTHVVLELTKGLDRGEPGA